MIKEDKILASYEIAKERYSALGVDTDKAIANAKNIRTSVHCWQGDDVAGFEGKKDIVSQNVVTGNYFGKARNGNELRADLEQVFAFSPLKHKVNLHSIYAEPAKPKDRANLNIDDFATWIDWAKANDLGLDYNPSFFAHEKMDGDLSLSSRDKATRDYWVEHGKSSRIIANEIGKRMGMKCVNNNWIPDGMKDLPAERHVYRANLVDSLDRMFATKLSADSVDVLEGKVFGIGTENFVVGSHEFYSSYALSHKLGICIDTGHYHPTENIADKISAFSPFFDDILFHVSRGVRWDSDHVVIQNDEVAQIMQEIARGNLWEKMHIGLDYFDASINRIMAWIIGTRAVDKSILSAFLEPTSYLANCEKSGDYGSRLAYLDEFHNLPSNAVWDYMCLSAGIPVGVEWISRIKAYEDKILTKR